MERQVCQFQFISMEGVTPVVCEKCANSAKRARSWEIPIQQESW
jgi:hypothetical protein